MIEFVEPRFRGLCVAAVAVSVLATCAFGLDARHESPSSAFLSRLAPRTATLADEFSDLRVEFQIDVPVEFMRTERNDPSQVDWGTRYAFDWFDEPHVTVRLQGMPTSLADAVRMLPGDRIIHAEATRDGYLVTSRSSNTLVRTLWWRRVSDSQSINCYTFQARRGGRAVPDIDATQARLERICRSLVIVSVKSDDAP